MAATRITLKQGKVRRGVRRCVCLTCEKSVMTDGMFGSKNHPQYCSQECFTKYRRRVLARALLQDGSDLKRLMNHYPADQWPVLTKEISNDCQVLGGNASDGASKVSFSDGPHLDSFARLRVSQPQTLFDSKQIFDNQPLFWDEELESGAGITSAHSTDTSSTTITSTVSTAGTFTRQTFQSFNYQPGKSQLIMMTGVLDDSGGGTGVKRRIGYFNDDDGIFFEDNAGVVYVVCRSSATGSPVDTAVAQTSWNVDKMDGTGISGVTTDWTKSQIFVMDLEWLGVGRVRLGLVNDGEVCYVHYFNNANVLGVVYMSTPNLPLRYQMITTASSPATTMECICSTVMAEGGQAPLGVTRYESTDGTHVDCATQDQFYAIIGLRLKTTHIGAFIELISTTILEGAGNKLCEWSLFFNPTVAGTFEYTDITNSALQTATGATANTVSGGYQITGGHLGSGVKGGGNGTSLQSAVRLGADISGNVDEVVLCAQPIGGTSNIDIEGGIEWREMP